MCCTFRHKLAEKKAKVSMTLPVGEAGGTVLHLGLGVLHDERQALGLLRHVVPLQRRRHVALGALPILRVLRRNTGAVLERLAGDAHSRPVLHLGKTEAAPNYSSSSFPPTKPTTLTDLQTSLRKLRQR